MLVSTNDAYQLCFWLDTAPSLPPSAPPPGWKFHFLPTSGDPNYAVILQRDYRPHEFAIVIQGTHDWGQILEDFDISQTPSFVNSENAEIIAGAQIALGASEAFNSVLSLTPGPLVTFEQCIRSIDWSKSSVLITGHSLGATIASLMAPWLASLILDEAPLTQPLPSNIRAITFAAFAAGNQEFADYLNNSRQYEANINVNDVVPNVWATTGPYQVGNVYDMYTAPGPSMPDGLQTDLALKVKSIPKGFNYIQTKESNTFAGAILAPPSFSNCKPKDIPRLQWEWEVSLQHNYAYCVQYIGSGCTQPKTDCPKS